VCIIKAKIALGVYEPSTAAYRSCWFCIVKKDGKSLCLVHDLQPLNTVTIHDASLLPFIEHLSYPIHSCFSSEVPDVRSDQI